MKSTVGKAKVKTTYVLESIESKIGEEKDFLHKQIEHRPCVLLRMEPGRFGWFAVEPEYDMGFLHRIHTSTIQNVEKTEDTVSVETANTFYKFRKTDTGDLCRTRFDLERWNEDIKHWEVSAP